MRYKLFSVGMKIFNFLFLACKKMVDFEIIMPKTLCPVNRLIKIYIFLLLWAYRHLFLSIVTK